EMTSSWYDIQHLLAPALAEPGDLDSAVCHDVHHLGRVALKLNERPGWALERYGDRGQRQHHRFGQIGTEADTLQLRQMLLHDCSHPCRDGDGSMGISATIPYGLFPYTIIGVK